jgi:hypothetical protein
VPSFDHTPIRVDVTLPTVPYQPPSKTKPVSAPLIVLMSGWSNDVCQFESTTLAGSGVTGSKQSPMNGCHGDYIGNPGYHWNNAWFASQGDVVLTYTPRGWYDSCGNDPAANYNFQNDSACSGQSYTDAKCPANSNPAPQESWVHLYDRRWEIRDAQFLAGQVFAGYGASQHPFGTLGIGARKIVASGDSGGGGPSWDLALSKDRILDHCTSLSTIVQEPWVAPNGTSLHLAAAIPMFTWTDLLDALMPNGQAADGFNGAPPDGNHLNPIGVEKQSYVDGLYALGQANAQYAPSGSDPDINKWYGDATAGEPFIVNSDWGTIVPELTGYLRSPLAIPVPSRGIKPIFTIQGLTDPLFPALQSETEIENLKTSSATYPVWGFFGDLGHSYAQNPVGLWQDAHNESNGWLTAVLSQKTLLSTFAPITMETAECGAATPQRFTGTDFGSVANAALSFSSAPSQTTTNSNAPTTEGTNSDPIANSSFCNKQESTDVNQATYTFTVPSASVLTGGPVLTVDVTLPPAVASEEMAVRLWDVTPGTLPNTGTQTLISRSVYRWDFGLTPPTAPTTQTVTMELFPNAWQLTCGHTLKLELTQDDSPTWRPDNVASTLSYANVSLSLPVRSGTAC